jgi:Na+/melibiose symporter-like transporter
MDFARLLWKTLIEEGIATDGEAELRAQAIHRIKRRRRFMSSLGTYLIFNGVLWLIWALTDHHKHGFPWPAWVSMIWGIAILLHAWRAFGVHRPITEADIQREMGRGRPRP